MDGDELFDDDDDDSVDPSAGAVGLVSLLLLIFDWDSSGYDDGGAVILPRIRVLGSDDGELKPARKRAR